MVSDDLNQLQRKRWRISAVDQRINALAGYTRARASTQTINPGGLLVVLLPGAAGRILLFFE
jgi:hypothetical protein